VNALLLGLAASLAAPALKDPPKDEPPVVGNWKLVEWIQSGTKVGFTDGAGVEFLPGGKRLWRDGPDAEIEERSYLLGAKSSPPAIDLIKPGDGPAPIAHPCIFKIDGDTLVIAVGPQDGERPKTFEEGRERGRALMTFKRIKKKE
jgi:uncharacterized protein (TIGR03067 family)